MYPEKKNLFYGIMMHLTFTYICTQTFAYMYAHSHTLTLTHTASQDLNAENSSLGDILEESDWDVNSDVAMATEGRGGALMKRSLQSEKEIRYITKKKVPVSGLPILCIFNSDILLTLQ